MSKRKIIIVAGVLLVGLLLWLFWSGFSFYKKEIIRTEMFLTGKHKLINAEFNLQNIMLEPSKVTKNESVQKNLEGAILQLNTAMFFIPEIKTNDVRDDLQKEYQKLRETGKCNQANIQKSLYKLREIITNIHK